MIQTKTFPTITLNMFDAAAVLLPNRTSHPYKMLVIHLLKGMAFFAVNTCTSKACYRLHKLLALM